MHPGDSWAPLGHLEEFTFVEDVGVFGFEELGFDDDEFAGLDVAATEDCFERVFVQEVLEFVAVGEFYLRETH